MCNDLEFALTCLMHDQGLKLKRMPISIAARPVSGRTFLRVGIRYQRKGRERHSWTITHGMSEGNTWPHMI